jgi:serine protease
MASPHVAGVAALLVSEGVTNPEAVENILERTARGEGRDTDRYGAGIIDAAAAVRHVQLYLGALQLALAFVLAGLIVAWFKRDDKLDGRPGVGLITGVVIGSSGLFFLPALVGMAIPEPFLTLLSRPIMAWDLALLGPGGHANPLFHSALLPVGLVLLFFGVSKLRPLVGGLSLGSAVYLAACSVLGTVDVTYLPYRFLDHGWLWINAVICLLLGMLVLRKAK